MIKLISSKYWLSGVALIIGHGNKQRAQFIVDDEFWLGLWSNNEGDGRVFCCRVV